MKFLKNFLFIIFLISITITISEMVCRFYGLMPFDTTEVKYEYKPSLPGKPDPIYGHSLVPGYFTLIKSDTFIFHATHDTNCRRVTSYGPLKSNYTGKLIVLGCSFTYGDCLEDSCTHPFILQKLFDRDSQKIIVENWGVGGYCPSQFFLYAQEIIKDSSVKYVVINYATFQDERTVCGREWRKSHVKYSKQLQYQKLIYFPYFNEEYGVLTLKRRTMDYTFLPFQKSLAIVEYIDELYGKFETRNAPEITQRALKLTIDALQKRGIKVILASITGDSGSNAVIRNFEKAGYTTLLYGFNTFDNGYNLEPADGHPNYRANKLFAESIYAKVVSLK